MDEEKTLRYIRQLAWKDVQYFSNANKEERERWTVAEFLSMLGVEYDNFEIKSLEQDNKIDVCFRNAQFQVKELPDPNLLRGKMYKDAYNSINAASCLDEITLISEVHDIPPIASMYDLVLEKARQLANSNIYKNCKSEIDLLIYITRRRASIIQQHEIEDSEFPVLGWRSVSCVNSKQAVVLYSTNLSPKFIRDREKQLRSDRE